MKCNAVLQVKSSLSSEPEVALFRVRVASKSTSKQAGKHMSVKMLGLSLFMPNGGIPSIPQNENINFVAPLISGKSRKFIAMVDSYGQLWVVLASGEW